MDKYSICTECGSKMTYRTNLEFTHGGITIKPVKGFKCEKCGEVEFESNEAKRIEKKYVEPQESEDDRVLPRVTPQESRWIPVKTRKLTDAEEQDMLENGAYYFNYMFDCLLPEDGEEVLITTSTGEATTTTFFDEGLNGCYFEFYEDDGDVIAWMPLPEPYKAESEG